MKTIKKQFKTIALILSLLILLHGCTVYKSASVSLDQAVNKGQKVKVITKDNVKLKFKRIATENGKYYGVRRSVDDKWVKILLNSDTIKTIKEKDKTLSTVLNIGIPVIYIGLLVWGGIAGWEFY
jgi:hypothetical protein